MALPDISISKEDPQPNVDSSITSQGGDSSIIENNKVVRTIHMDYGTHIENTAVALFGSLNIPSEVLNKYDLPVVAGDEVIVYYSGEWIEQETYPSTIIIENGGVVSASVKHLRMVELEIVNNPGGGKSERPVKSGEVIGKYLTRNCINSDGTFNDLFYYSIGTHIWAVDQDGDFLAFYSYNPYEIFDNNRITITPYCPHDVSDNCYYLVI